MQKIGTIFKAAVVTGITLAAVALAAARTTAAYSSHRVKSQSVRPVPHYVAAHRWYAPRGCGPVYAYPPRTYVYHGPGYTFVPHRGIIDEACNLPTSACPNEMRDVR